MTRRAEEAASRATTTAIADWLRTVADPTDLALLGAILEIRRSTHSTQSIRDGRPGTWRPARPVGPDPRLHLVRLLAVRYADRPGYRPEWAPTTSGA